jgi:hypothetical protein
MSRSRDSLLDGLNSITTLPAAALAILFSAIALSRSTPQTMATMALIGASSWRFWPSRGYRLVWGGLSE